MKREFKVGLLVIIAGAVLYLGFSFLKGKDLFVTDSTYYAKYDNIDGLTVSNPVVLNGFNIGRVDNIEILHDQNDSLLVSFTVKSGVPINDLSVAELISSDILGGKAILLKLNNGTRLLENNGYLKTSKETSLAKMIQNKALPVISNVDTLVAGFKDYLRGDNEKNINSAIANLSKTMQSFQQTSVKIALMLSENRGNVNKITSDLTMVTQDLSITMKKLGLILENVDQFSDSLTSLDLKSTVDQANSSIATLGNILSKVQSDTGTLGLLINSPDLHQNLNTTLRDVDYLVTDMQANPKRYIQFSVLGSKTKDEKAIIKSIGPKHITNQVEIALKRNAPSFLVVKLYRPDRTALEIIPSGLGTKNISFKLPSGFGPGEYLAKLDWDISSEAFSFLKE